MKRVAFAAWSIITLALGVGFSTLLFPAPASVGATDGFYLILIFSVMVGVLQPGAAVLFVWGFVGFKRQLRIAYGAICVALVLLGLAQVQAAFLTYFGLSTSFWVVSGLVVVPYIAPVILMFYGVRLFAKLFELKTIWMSFWFVLGLATAVAIGVVLVARLTSNDTQFLLSVGLAIWTTMFMFASVVISLKTYKIAGAVYRPALRWFAAANAVVVFAGASYVLSFLVLGNNNILIDYGTTVLPHMVAGLLYIRAAYLFKLINQEQAPVPAAQQVTLIDIIIFEASLASNPAQIDEALDTVRIITASGAQTVTPEQQASLRQVYRIVEQFLVEKEPIRQFTVQDVRQKIARNFGMSDEDLLKAVGVPSQAAPSQPLTSGS